jgi:hypothetical protein
LSATARGGRFVPARARVRPFAPMKLLEAEPALAPSPPQDIPAQPQAPAEPVAPARACATCGAAMEGEQDWCLQCGTAAAGRLGARPGWRSALTVAGLTLALVAGAVAAAYAAMSSDAAREASGPVAAAEAGAPVAAPTPGVPAAEAPPIEPVTPGDLPSVTPGAGADTEAPAAEPVEPVTPETPTPTTPAPAAEEPEGEGGAEPSTTTPDAGTRPQPAKVIELAEGAGAPYDPLGRVDASSRTSDPARALDGDRGTSWAVRSSNPLQPGVGYVVDVGEARRLREVELRTSTPGFKVEVYATDEATAPPEITDTRWAHLRDRSDVKATQRIVLSGGGGAEYRQLLLWFTEPPAEGARIRLTELRLLG